MSFRLKIMLGVGLLSAALLLMLTYNSISYLTKSNQEELLIRAETTSRLIADLSRDAVLSTDVAALSSEAEEILRSPEIVYIRIYDVDSVLVSAGDEAALARAFHEDRNLQEAVDGVFDATAPVMLDGERYGRVEIGFSLSGMQENIDKATQSMLVLVLVDLVLIVLFSLLLGSYLTRRLSGLTKAAQAITDGDLEAQVQVKGRDEIALAGEAFNTMAGQLAENQRDMRHLLSVSQRVATEKAKQEKRISAILDTAVDGIVTIDGKGIIEDINKAGAALFGYTRIELVGRNVSCLMPAPYSKHHDGYLDNYARTGHGKVIGIDREVEGLRKDGTTFPLDLAVSEVKVDDQKMFVGMVRDISEQKRLEAESRRSNAMMSAIVDANLDALVTIDIENRIVEFSRVAEEMFGHKREDVIGRSLSELLIPPNLREAHAKGMETFRISRQGPVLGQRIEVPALRSNGDTFPTELTVQHIEVDGESFFTAFLRDISERKAAEDALTDAKQKAEAASEAKSRFLAHMSHEIRSPLNAVLGSVGLLLDDDLNNEQRLYAKTAETSGKSLLGLINDVLDFSKIEAGEFRLDVQRFRIKDLIADVADLIALKAHGKPVQTAVGASPDIDEYLMGDPIRLRQILINLTDNALKFTEQGAVTLAVEKSDESDQRVHLRFTVEDSGIGIADDAQARLFDEFQQVDSSDSTRYGGTGLGLSICKGLSHAMGGEIRIESRLGEGSRFIVDIPFDKAEPGRDAKNEGASRQERRILNRDVIVVGLHPMVRKVMQLYCVTENRCAFMVESAEQAMAHLTAETRAVVVDAMLPVEALQALWQRVAKLDVPHRILVSSSMSNSSSQLIQDGVFDDLMLMPLVMSRLVKLLREGASSGDEPSSISSEAEHSLMDDSQSVQGASKGKRLLLAEDSPANQMVAKAMLGKAGYAVDVVENGRQAVEAFQRGDYDLILMDLRMPEMDGLEATEQIRALQQGERIPIVAMTANAQKEDVDRCMAAGMDDFVAKPVDKEKLLEALARHLGASADELREVAEESPAAAATEPLLDPAAIEMLADDTSPEVVPDMLRMFIEEITTRSNRVRDGLQTLSMHALEDEAHTLKSCAGTFGAVRMQALARDMETACREGDRHGAELLGERLDGVLQDTLDIYAKHYDYLA